MSGFKLGKIGTKSADDVVIVSCVRTAICNARKGAFAKVPIEDLLTPVFAEAVKRSGVDPKLIGDICVGNVLGNSIASNNACRMAQFMAQIPPEVPLSTTNRQCASGLNAIAYIAAQIAVGSIDIGLAAGVESMSNGEMPTTMMSNPKVLMNENARDLMLPMLVTSENVAQDFKVSREEQDKLAVLSNQRAMDAAAKGYFKDEIVPVTVVSTDPKTGAKTTKIVTADEGPMPTTLDKISKLKPALGVGATTAANASKVSDGASCIMLMRRSTAEKLGCPIMAVYRGTVFAGVAPKIMGMGPLHAIPKCWEKLGITEEQKKNAVYELNEAFASQALACCKGLGLNMDNVNPLGGSIAMGHPLGSTSCAKFSTLIYELRRRQAAKTNGSGPYIGFISQCIGGGQGGAACISLD